MTGIILIILMMQPSPEVLRPIPGVHTSKHLSNPMWVHHLLKILRAPPILPKIGVLTGSKRKSVHFGLCGVRGVEPLYIRRKHWVWRFA